MEALTMIYPPNKPLERALEPSKHPIMYDYLLFIDANKKGELIVGSSNISGTYWEGTLHHYESFKSLKENFYSGYFISNTTTSDALFLDDNNVLLSEDNGTLLILNTEENNYNLLSCRKKFSKSQRVTKLSTWGSYKAIASYGASIDVYDLESDPITLENTYCYYHTDVIRCVDTNKSDLNLFSSCSMDRKACVWDIRLKNPASVMYQNEFCPLNSIIWLQDSPHLIIGSDSGDVYSLDIRKPKEILNVIGCFNNSIYRMAHNNGLIAVCGDTSQIIILKFTANGEFEKIKQINDHSSVVRGVTWCNNTLYSCGYNKEVFSNQI
nr:uncharacterized protein LOC111421886 [Onthophagus taurus]